MSGHLKRLATPTSWKIPRKTHHWVVKPRPGPHPADKSIPLLLIIRDMLGLANNAREAKKILKEDNVLVDGRIRRDHKFPVGLFDVVSIPAIKKHFRASIDEKNRLHLEEISGEGAKTKLCKVEGKRTIKGGRIQLNLHDGRNLLGSNDIKPKDTVVIRLEDNEVIDRIPYERGSEAMIIDGKHAGEVGIIKDIKTVRSPRPNTCKLEADGKEIETIEDYVFVLPTKG